MKKYLAILITFILGLASAAGEVIAPSIEQAVKKYKVKNYVGCIQDTQDIIKADPANALAHYYMAISYASIGNGDEAVKAYEKVLSLSTNYTLNEFAQKGKRCIENPSECNPQKTNVIDVELEKFLNSGQVLSDETKKQLQRIQIEQIKNNINKEADLKSEMPTNDEIAEAVKTLARAGLNPLQQTQNPYIQAQQALAQNPEYLQLQMMLGNNNQNGNNDFIGMLPYFMTQQNNNSNMSADMIKNMMMSSMVGNMSTTFNMDENK